MNEKQLCPYDPRELAGAPIGMFHCPACGEMVIAGLAHPKPNERDEMQQFSTLGEEY